MKALSLQGKGRVKLRFIPILKFLLMGKIHTAERVEHVCGLVLFFIPETVSSLFFWQAIDVFI